MVVKLVNRSSDGRSGAIEAGGAYRRADRERQVGAGARAAEERRHHHQRRSMQVYRDLRIITARPARGGGARAAPALAGVDAAESYSSAAGASMREQRWPGSGGRLPIVVGGTGLYFKILTQGLAAVRRSHPTSAPPSGNGSTPRALRRSAELTERDPASAQRLMPGDRARVTRALEVVLATGRPLTDWHRDGMQPALDPDRAVKIFLEVGARRALSAHRCPI
jgi:tRNA dimethylallyltransferase